MMTSIPTFVATRLYQPWRAILSVINRCLKGKDISWDKARLPDEFEWQVVDRMSRPIKQSKLIYTQSINLIIDHFLSTNKSISQRYNAEMHSEGQDSPISKLINTVDGVATKDPGVQSLLDLRKGSKESRLESMRQERQVIGGEGSSVDTDEDKDDETNNAEDSNMDIYDNDSDKGDVDDTDVFAEFVNKSQELPKFTPLSPSCVLKYTSFVPGKTLLIELKT
nr:hypothetical protein [Tanacetum cinerariifolium]